MSHVHRMNNHRRSIARFAIAAAAVMLCLSLNGAPVSRAQNANGKTPLTHEAMWLMKRVGAPLPSPDGRWVVFSLVEPAYDEKDQTSDLWIVPADGAGKPRRLTFTKGGESGAAWSPNSQQLAFSAKREGDEVNQIYVMDVAAGGEAALVTSLSTGARAPVWRPDGRALLCGVSTGGGWSLLLSNPPTTKRLRPRMY